jgi:3-oxosteroid 1-dehydrogenase
MSESNSARWDHSVDLLVVGSGAGALTAALVGHDSGANSLVIEKSSQFGGTSAMSGGALWVPANYLMDAEGIDDTPAEGLDYLKAVTKGGVPEDRLQAYIEHAPAMLQYLRDHSHLDLQNMPTYTDYYPELSGGKSGGRSIEPHRFDAKQLGAEFEQMREAHPQVVIMNRMSMTATEAHTLLARHKGWLRLMLGMMGHYLFDLPWRFKSNRDRSLCLGQALVATLRKSLSDRGVPLWLNAPAKQLIVEDGRVVGVEVEKDGKTMRVRAEKGVVLAAGGFEANDGLRQQYLPKPTSADWTAACATNQGDPLQMGLAIGAGTEYMDEAWWGPTMRVPGEDRARMLVHEKGLPHCIFVDKTGKRFANEATTYTRFTNAMFAHHSDESPTVPCYMFFDASYRKKYPFGPVLQASQMPDRFVPKHYWDDGFIYKADSIDALAQKMGVDPAGVQAEVAKFNGYCESGVDPDFQRGESLFDRYYGDENVEPNPCMGRLETAPYYGVIIYPGDLGTKGGLNVDAKARVLDTDGAAIEGLYAIGNCSASVMGKTYPGAGSTLGPAMAFGYVAAKHLTGKL